MKIEIHFIKVSLISLMKMGQNYVNQNKNE